MIFTIPDYYREFACIAGDCPDTCCAGWQIVIDEKSRKKYKRYPGSFGRRLRASVDWREGSFCQNRKRCAFLNEDNLCDIYKNAGEHMLCDTCRRYPRHVEEYEDLREISLSISCPVVARMLLGRKEPVKFLTKERKMPPEEYEEFDYMLFTKLCDARELMISILQNRKEDVRTRMAMVLALGHDLQRRISADRLYEADEILERYASEGAFLQFEKRCRDYREIPSEATEEISRELDSLMDELEVLKDDFPSYRRERMGKGVRNVSEDEAVCLEQLMVYFIYTYFCGAVYDFQAYGKVKFAVASTMMIRTLWVGDVRFGTELAMEAMIEAAYRYSREVEHSDNNLLHMEEMLLGNKLLGIENMIKLLWQKSS